MRLIIGLAILLAGCSDGTSPTSKDGEFWTYTIDGDTFKDGSQQSWRLARIDAAELPGHCRPGRECAKGDPRVATAVLQSLLSEVPIRCKLITTDAYGRNIGECWTKSGKNISNEMLRLGVVEEYRR